MNGAWRVLFALAVWLASVGAAHAGTRHALVVGTNEGLADEPVLEFAESDARALAQTFVDSGAVDAGRVTTLLGRPLAELSSAFVQLGARLRPDDELWVFLSGHADQRGVHVRGVLWEWRDLQKTLDALPVRRLLVFVDACNSGALLTAKGLSLGAPLRLSVEARVRGRVVLASSGANELSYESRRLGGSPFAHFLQTGLRGAADTGDGRVSLSELYSYLYSRTVAASLAGAAGPQHPEHGGWFRGAGEWWLTERAPGGAELLLRDASLGRCWVLDPSERQVLAEVQASDPGPVSLPPAAYRVKCRRREETLVASLSLASGRTHLESLPFATTETEVVLARGPAKPARHQLGAWVGARFDPLPEPVLSVGFRRSTHDLSLGASVGLLGERGFAVQGELLGRMPWWGNEALSLEVGWLLGVESRFDAAGASLALGPLVELSTPLSPSLRLTARQEMTRTIPLDDRARPGLPLTTRLGSSFEW